MRHLVVADLHYSLRQMDWVLREAGHFDGVIIAGDLLDLGSLVEHEAQAIVVLKYLARLSAAAPTVLVTSGNHDLESADDQEERTAEWLVRARSTGARVDGDACVLDGWQFTLCPWWEGEAGRQRVAAQLSRDATQPRRRWAWIHHAPPHDARVSWTGRADAGDPVLTRWIHEFSPDVVLSGHIHQAPFQEGGAWVDRIHHTWVFNTGAYLAPQPPFIVLDLSHDSAEWSSAAGDAKVQLTLQ